MKKTEKAVLIEGLRKLSADMMAIVEALEGKPAEKADEAEDTGAPEQKEAPAETKQN